MFAQNTLEGKSAFIAGGTSGINLGIAKGMAQLGARVAVVGRNPEKAENAAREIIDETGGKAIAFSADVREPEQVDAALSGAVKEFGALNIIVSGAAGNFFAPAVSITPKGFKTVVDIDLIGTYQVFHLGFSHCTDDASMIAITAPQAVMPMPGQAHVCAAKAGINMLIKTLALEWGPRGIRVNGISPGAIDNTEGLDRLAPSEADRQHWLKRLAARRFADKVDIANAAIYLASDLGGYVNGSILTVDGGFELGDAGADCLTPTDR